MGILIEELQSIGFSTLSGSTEVHGTLTVHDSVDFLSRLEVSGTLYVDGDVTLTGSTIIGGSLEVNTTASFHNGVSDDSANGMSATQGFYVGSGQAATTSLTTGSLQLDSKNIAVTYDGVLTVDGVPVGGGTGTSGIDGTSGTSGVDGISGNDGTSGTSGTSGVSPYKGLWLDSVCYFVGDIVSYNSILYTCTVDIINCGGLEPTIPPTVDASWVTLAGTSGVDGGSGLDGTSGTSGISPYKGLWLDSVCYFVGDIVSYNSILYSCNTDIINCGGMEPTSPPTVDVSWTSLSGSNGTSGVDGAAGTSGIDGTSGSSGIDGINGTSGVDGIGFDTSISNTAILYKDSNGFFTGNTTNSPIAHMAFNDVTGNIRMGSFNANWNDAGQVNFNAGINSSMKSGALYSAAFGSSSDVRGETQFCAGWVNDTGDGQGNIVLGGMLVAAGKFQTVVGAYNVATGSTDINDENSPRFIVGTGISGGDKRNGFLVRANGNVEVAGSLTVNGSPVAAPWSEPLNITISANNPRTEFQTLVSAIAYLQDNHMSGNTTMLLTADNEVIDTQITVNLPYSLAIKGGAYEQNYLTAGAGLTGAMFNLQSNVSFTKVIFSGITTVNCINVATNDLYIEVKDFLITNFNKGIYSTSNSEFWIMEGGISNCKTAGFELNTSHVGARYRSVLTDYSSDSLTNQYIGINLISGTTIYFSSEHDTTELSNSAQTFVKYTGTQISYTDFTLNGCIWNNIGTFRTGFDFTLKRDADMALLNNTGDESMLPHAKFTVLNNTGVTSITAVNTPLVFKTATTYAKKFSWTESTGRVTYLPTHKKSVLMWISGTLTTSSQPSTIDVSIMKNGQTGVTFGNISVFLDQNARSFNWSSNIYLDSIIENDYFQIVGKSTTNETIILQDLNWLILSQ